MSLTCPDNVLIYAAHNPGGIVVITLDDLGITDSNNANFFFENESGAAALVEFIDEAGGTTVWSTTNAPDPQRNGDITNDGTTITYTQGATSQEGDCVTIKYYADNQQGTPDDECDQTFLLCLWPRPNNQGCVADISKSASADDVVLTNADFGITDNNCSVFINSAGSLDVISSNTANTGGALLRGASSAGNTQPITYTIICPGEQNVVCNANINFTGGSGLTCTNRQTWVFNTLPAAIQISELGANAQGTIQLTSLTINGQPASTANPQIGFPAGSPDGTYDMDYTITDGVDTISCSRQFIINVNGGQALICTSRASWTFTSLPGSIAVAELGANGQGPLQLTAITVNGQPATITNNRLDVPVGTANGTYDIAYTVTDGVTSVSCTKQYIVNSSGVGTGTGNALGGPDCANSTWTGGRPTLQCGSGPQQYEVSIRDANGNAVTQPFNTISFGLIGLPAGSTVNAISDNGAGTYIIEIDLSEVNCSGSFEAYLGYTL